MRETTRRHGDYLIERLQGNFIFDAPFDYFRGVKNIIF